MKSYARNGRGEVCAFNSRAERDRFVQLVNEKLDNDRMESRVDDESYMTTCAARDAYKVRDRVDKDGEAGAKYYDMRVLEFFDGDWDVLDKMYAG